MKIKEFLPSVKTVGMLDGGGQTRSIGESFSLPTPSSAISFHLAIREGTPAFPSGFTGFLRIWAIAALINGSSRVASRVIKERTWEYCRSKQRNPVLLQRRVGALRDEGEFSGEQSEAGEKGVGA